MQETAKDARRILEASAAHIDSRGLLGGGWMRPVEDDADGPPCGCLIGTMRHCAGLDPSPGVASAEWEDANRPNKEGHKGLAAALAALRIETADERADLAERFQHSEPLAEPHPVKGEDVRCLGLVDYSDHHHDHWAVTWYGERVARPIVNYQGEGREHLAQALRRAAGRV